MEQFDAAKPAQSTTTTPPEAEPMALAARVATIRAGLPGQVLRERIDTARLLYGALYAPAEIRQRVAETLPPRLGLVRGARLEPIETYGERIPDEALLKYDEALQKRLFARFWVAVPTYNRQQQIDPWIFGEVSGTEVRGHRPVGRLVLRGSLGRPPRCSVRRGPARGRASRAAASPA